MPGDPSADQTAGAGATSGTNGRASGTSGFAKNTVPDVAYQDGRKLRRKGKSKAQARDQVRRDYPNYHDHGELIAAIERAYSDPMPAAGTNGKAKPEAGTVPPPPEAAKGEDGFDGTVTEDAAAMVFADHHRDNLRYCHGHRAWFLWDGAIWQEEMTRVAYHWCRQVARNMTKGADKKTRATAGKASFAGGVERMAQSDRALAVTAGLWNTDAMLLGTPGGTVELRTGELRASVRNEHINKSTRVAPSATADCPIWLKFLNEAAKGDADLVAFIQRWLGYSLTGDTRERKLIFLFGPGDNGKGILLNSAAMIVGDYAVNAAHDTFTETRAMNKHTTDLAMLEGSRFVCTTEVDEGQNWSEGKVKVLTGGTDRVTARFMRQDNRTFSPQFKLSISGNHKPRMRNVDPALKARILIVPFLYVPPVPDRQLAEKLIPEWPGILRWMIEGCLEWQRIGLAVPDVVKAASNEYFETEDVFGRWVEECCELGPSFEDRPANLLHSFQVWCEQNGEPESDNRRLRGLIERRPGLKYFKNNTGRWVRGIRLPPMNVPDMP